METIIARLGCKDYKEGLCVLQNIDLGKNAEKELFVGNDRATESPQSCDHFFRFPPKKSELSTDDYKQYFDLKRVSAEIIWKIEIKPDPI